MGHEALKTVKAQTHDHTFLKRMLPRFLKRGAGGGAFLFLVKSLESRFIVFNDM